MKKMLSKVKILIVDDHSMVREGLRLRISAFPDLEVCGEDDAVAIAKETNPGLVIIDISLKDGHGIELIKRLKAISPKVKMLVAPRVALCGASFACGRARLFEQTGFRSEGHRGNSHRA